MAKISGLGWTTLAVDDAGGTARDIKNDVNSFEMATPRQVDDVTGLDSSSIERVLLLGDYSASFDGTVNFATNMSHDVFSTACSADVARTITATIAANTLAVEALITDYKVNRGSNGAFKYSASAVLADGTDPTWS